LPERLHEVFPPWGFIPFVRVVAYPARAEAILNVPPCAEFGTAYHVKANLYFPLMADRAYPLVALSYELADYPVGLVYELPFVHA
jgi:hypothetical protein